MNIKLTLLCITAALLSACGGGDDEDCAAGGADEACDEPSMPDESGVEIVAIAAGDEHTCAVSADGELKCWGNGRFGRLGYGTYMDRLDCDSNTTEFTCAPVLLCCVGDSEAPRSQNPISVVGDVVQLSAGRENTCAVFEDGELRCWGRNQVGQLGLAEGVFATIGDDEFPGVVDPIELGAPVVQASVGAEHICAVVEGGGLYCWGSGQYGRLGSGSVSGSLCAGAGEFECFSDPACCVGDDELAGAVAPVAVGGAVAQVAAAAVHTCALLESGELRCWGDNSFGQLGYGTTDRPACQGDELAYDCDADPSCCVGDDEAPRDAGPVSVGGRVVQVSTGGAFRNTGGLAAAHTCAVLEGGALRCWGDNAYGQLGYGHTETIGDDELPSDVGVVDVGGPVVQVAAGASHTCAVLESGELRCWGDNSFGQLGLGRGEARIGDDETPASIEPVNIGGAAREVAVGGGPDFWGGGSPKFSHTCARLEDGSVRCWGSGTMNNGQLGYGDTGSVSCLLNTQILTSFSCSAGPQCCVGDEAEDMPPPPVEIF